MLESTTMTTASVGAALCRLAMTMRKSQMLDVGICHCLYADRHTRTGIHKYILVKTKSVEYSSRDYMPTVEQQANRLRGQWLSIRHLIIGEVQRPRATQD